MVKTVPRFSSLSYVMAIGRKCQDTDRITDHEILDALCEERSRIELGRLAPLKRILLPHAEDIDYWRNKYQKRAIETRKLLLRWRLLAGSENEEWKVSRELKDLGNSYNQFIEKGKESQLERARRILMDQILHRESPFSPSRFLLNIRDSDVKEIDTKYLSKDAYSSQKSEGTTIVSIQQEGVAYSTKQFVEDTINTTFVSFDVMRDWSKFFELANWFPFSIPSQQELKVISPKFGIYLTRFLMSSEEAILTIELLETEKNVDPPKLLSHLSNSTGRKYSDYATRSILSCLWHLGLIKQVDKESFTTAKPASFDLQSILNLAIQRNELVVAEGKSCFVVQSYSESIDKMKTYFLVKPRLSADGFYHALKTAFKELCQQPAQHFVSIPALREKTCMLLKINDSDFDRLLIELADSMREKLHFAKIPLRYDMRKYREGIVLNNVLYYSVSIKS